MQAIILLLLSFLIFAFTGHLSTLVFPILFFFLGKFSILVFSDKENASTYNRIYCVTFVVYLAYAVICYIFMRMNGFECLTVTDTINTYIPDTQYMMSLGFKDMIEAIFRGYGRYEHSGIILIYWAYIAKFGSFLGGELYFDMQMSVLFLSAFVPVFLYRLLVQYNVNNPYKCSLIYAFCSIFALYSTLILRDAPIAFLYMIALSYIKSDSIFKKNIIFISCIALVFLIRPSMGFFLCLFYLVSFYPSQQVSNKSNFTTIIAFVIVGVAVVYFFNQYSLFEALERNTAYMENQEENASSATLYRFGFLPPILEELVKSVYIHLSPIPAIRSIGILEPVSQTRNIMHFPTVIATFYNYIVFGFIIMGIRFYKMLEFTKRDLYFFLGALIFLLLQTSSTEQRRIMICYPILFLFAVTAYQKVPQIERKNIFRFSVFVFSILQIIGIL